MRDGTLKVAAALCAACAAAAAGAGDFRSPAEFNPSWESANPGTFRSTTIPTGALLGNGSLGAVNGGDGNHKEFVLTRGDLWSCGAFTCGGEDSDIRPISFADFDIGPGMHTVASTDTLDIATETLRTEGRFGKGKVKYESYVSADDDVFVLSGVSEVDDSWVLRLRTHNQRKSFPLEAGVSSDGFWVRRSTLNLLPKDDPRGWVTNAIAAVSVLGAELTDVSAPHCGESRGTAKIRAGKPFAFVVAADPARRFTWDELAKIRASHEAWWREWWARSRVATGDEELDRFYHGQVYLLGAGVRKGKFPPGLYGIWVTTDNPKWHNDFHMNYNYVGTYYGCFAANRCEVADAMPDPLIDYLPQAVRNAKENLQKLDTWRKGNRFFKNTREYLDGRKDLANGIDDAALYPVAMGPWGSSAEGDVAFLSQVSDGAFQCAVMCTHWEYTLDRAYLKKVWPVLDKTANFFLKWCEKEGGRYNVWDSHWECSGLEKNSAPALGSVKHLFETLVEAAPVLREMGIEVPDAKLAAWKDMHEHLSPLPVGVYPIDGKPVKMLSGVENADGSANPSGGNALNLESVIPGEQFSFDVTPEFRALAVGAVDGNIAKSPKDVWKRCNQTPKLFATAIRAGYSPHVIIDAFKKHQLRVMQKNFHIHDGVHGVEKIGAMEFVQSMLIQCDHGYVKVFPNWTGADAKFENLRAKGCFLVSAEMKDGKVVRVEVKSEKGGRFRLVDPSGRGTRPACPPPSGWTRGMTRNSGEPTIERDFRPGESVLVAFGCDVSPRGAESLEAGFASPPNAAKPQTWYHLMNGNVTKAGITRDFEELARAGFGGVQIFDVGCDIPPGDVKFGSDEWFGILRHAHSEAKRLRLELGIHNCSGWSCSGGPWVAPADAMKVTMHSDTVATGPARFSKRLARIKKDNGFYADIAVLAYPTPEPGATLSDAAEKTGRVRRGAGLSYVRDTKEFPAAKVIAKDKVIDVTEKMAKDGTLTWDVPAGKWSILRLGYICNGRVNRLPSKDGYGLEVDKFSTEAFDRHFDAYMGRLCRELGMRAGDVHITGLCNIHVDSWEVGCQNWTHGLEKIFEKRVGYSIIPYLPILAGRVVGSVDESERFCEDFRRLLSDLLAENYGRRFAERCHEYGLRMSAEPYGPSNADDMQYGEVVDIPMSCFWVDGTCGPGKFPCMDNSHYAASLAHVWGRRYVADEAFTAGPPKGGRWLETPFSIKWQNDRAFAKGCNLIVYHRFTHQPWADDRYLPGMTMGRWGMHLDRTQTWWPLAGGWFRYQARCQWMLQEGMFCADALFWGGEAAPKHGWPNTTLPKGYDYDVCATKVVEMLKVKDGKVVVPGGLEYEILVLPDTDTMSERMVKRIGELVDAGARVVAPRKPTRAPGLGRARSMNAPSAVSSRPPYRELVDSVWSKGVMECSPEDALRRLGVAHDFECAMDDVAWIHRRDDSADWYFVACGSRTNVTFEASFRQAGRVPEVWDAETGEIREADVWRTEGGRTVVALDFPPSGSAFVVFRNAMSNVGCRTSPSVARDVTNAIDLAGPWQVSFPVDWYTGGTNVKTVAWKELKDWTADDDNDIKYFSGTAVYHVSCLMSHVSPRSRVVLDLGEVKDFAEVTVNVVKFPPLWRPPFRVDITDAVKTASVQQQSVIDIEVKVTNLWPNRLIGDEALYPADCEWELRWHNWQKLNEPGIKEIPQWVKEGRRSPTGRHTFTTWKHWTKDDKLLPSGMLGPVRIFCSAE